MDTPDLSSILTALRKLYPDAAPPKLAGLFEIVLFENVAYLVPDQRRAAVWEEFCSRIGTEPAEILATDPDLLVEVLKPGGMHPQRRAEKVLECCAIVDEEFDGDPDKILALEGRARRKAIKKFPGFGDPGVDKVLMWTRSERILALESNGLRVLLRLGFGSRGKSYAAEYRSVQDAIADQVPKRFDAVIRAHFLLRRHGQELCKNSRPHCEACALAPHCPSA